MEPVKYYKIEEISKNNGKDGNEKVWIIYKDSVYDVTEYLVDHPGGGDLITEWAGKDSTKAFDDFGHSGDAKKEMKKYKIGEVALEDRKTTKQKKSDEKTVAVKVVDTDIDAVKANRRSCIAIITCGLCG